MKFAIQVEIDIPKDEWEKEYGGRPDPAGVRAWLENALYVGTTHVTASVTAANVEESPNQEG